MPRYRMTAGPALLALGLLAAGCNLIAGQTPAPAGPHSFVSGETLTLEGRLAYWPSGQTGRIQNLSPNPSARGIYSTDVAADGSFRLIAGPPPNQALGDFGACQNQLSIRPSNPAILALSLGASQGGTFAGYVEETEGGSRDEVEGRRQIDYLFNGGAGTWVKGTCRRTITAGAFTQTFQVTYQDVYLYPGWNALVLRLDTYQRGTNTLTEAYTAKVAQDEVGFSWVFEDFNRN